MFLKLFFVTVAFGLVGLIFAGPRDQYDQTTLDVYVHAPDKAYEYKIVKTQAGEGYTSFLVDLVSQTFLILIANYKS